MARLAGCTKKAGVPGRRQGRRDLAGDVAGLAHAGDDDAALGATDQLDRGDEGPANPIADRRRERVNTAGLGLKGPQRRCDERMAGTCEPLLA